MKKPSGLVCGPVNSDGATLAVVNHLQQEDMLSLTKPQKLIKSLSKPTASLVQAEILVKPHQNFWSSHLPHSLFSTSVVLLFQQEKAKMFKRKQETEHDANTPN